MSGKPKKNQRRLAPIEVVGVRRDEDYYADEGDYIVELKIKDPQITGMIAGMVGQTIAIDIDATLAGQPAPDVISIVEAGAEDEG